MSRKICLSIKAILALGTALTITSSVASANSHAPKRTSPEQVIYAFSGGADGGDPGSPLIADQAGNFYGTTSKGGDASCNYGTAPKRPPPPTGCGVLFKLAPDGTETILHTFGTTSNDGIAPGTLTFDSAGNLYGTTGLGGANGAGTIFEITSGGVYSILYSFDTFSASSNLLLDAEGNFYATGLYLNGGACGKAGEGCGNVFEYTPGGTPTVLYNFTGQPDGAEPEGNIAMDSSGDIYGTTYYGGTGGGEFGYGTVFELTPDGTESVLYSFPNTEGGAPGLTGVIIDGQGNLYGTTGVGGLGDGTVFEVAADGTESTLFEFNGSDGFRPSGRLILDGSGNLYGTTSLGGANSNCNGGCGTVFELTSGGAESVLFSFGRPKRDGWLPQTGVTFDQSGNLYGTTGDGGISSKGPGLVFKLTP
jgi:uncharacterized repeat protein (TIGR03803 family)